MHRVLLITEDEALRAHLRPMSQWIDLRAPPKPIDALEALDEHQPDVFIVDARAVSAMVLALLEAVRSVPRYRNSPLILLGKSPHEKKFRPNVVMDGKFRLFRLEEKIAECLGIRLSGRVHHGPHSGAVS